MGNMPVNDVNPNFVHGYRGPASVQEQLAVSQSRVHSLLGTLQPGPPQMSMHVPPPMQAQHHPPPVMIQQQVLVLLSVRALIFFKDFVLS